MSPQFSKSETVALNQEIAKMIDKGAVEQVSDTPGQIMNFIFLPPKKDGSLCPIFNMKSLNACVKYQHFKMEGIHLALDMTQQGDFFVKLDLKDAYFTVNMHQDDRKFLRFRWRGELYQFV